MNEARRVFWGFWIPATAALVAGLLLRLWFIGHQARVMGDTFVYGDIAKNLLQHGVYGFTEDGAAPTPTLIRLPGYPLFLAVCFRLFGVEHYGAVLRVQAAADLVSCGLVSALAGRLFGPVARLPVLWLAALCPFTASYTAAGLTETLSLFCIAAVFYGFARWQGAGAGYGRWLWVTAAALAYAILLRPEQVLLTVAVLAGMAWVALGPVVSQGSGAILARPALRRLAPVLAAGLCVVLPLVPWTARNWRTFQVVQPLAPRYANDPGETPPLGFNRWYRTWGIDFASTETAYWNYGGDRIELGDLPRRAFGSGCDTRAQPLLAKTTALLADYNRTMKGTPEIEARFAALAQERIRDGPLCYYLALPVARGMNMLFRPRVEMMPVALEWWRWRQHRVQTAFALTYGALNVEYLALGLAGWIAWRRRGWFGWQALAWAMAACILLRLGLLLTIDNSEPRYTLELFPLLIVWAGGLWASGTQPEA